MSIIGSYQVQCPCCRARLLDLGAQRVKRRYRATHVSTEATAWDTYSAARKAAFEAGWLGDDLHGGQPECVTCRESTDCGY